MNAAHGVAHDALVQRWEQALFGTQLSRRVDPRLPLALLEHADARRLSFLLPDPGRRAAGALVLGAAQRLARRGPRMMSTFYACYAVFFLFPVAGPRYSFATAENAATAVPLAVFSHRFLELGSAWGTAFPSSHVAAALVAAVCAWRGWRPLGAVLLVAAALLTLATVYCQFHYGIDALCGVVVAALVLSVLREPRADARARE